MGGVPYQALPLQFLRIIFTREKASKGEGEPGEEANTIIIITCTSILCNANPVTLKLMF